MAHQKIGPKILIVDTYYPEFVRQLYQSHPEKTTASYDEQLTWLLGYHFGTGDSYSFYLRTLGYEAGDVVADILPLQAQWAKEHEFKLRRPPLPLPRFLQAQADRLSLYKALLSQITEFKPDILYMQNLSFCDPLFLRKIKRQVRLLVGQIACPLPPTAFLKPYDLIVTSFPHFVERLRKRGIASEYFKIGFEERILNTLAPEPVEKKYDVVFIGGFTAVHHEATAALEALAVQIPVDVWGYGIDQLTTDSPLRQRYHGEAWAMDMYRIIRQAKICVNRHSAAAEQHANNMRLYETTGLGTCLITDMKENLPELFAVGQEVVTYQSTPNLIDKVQYYLAHNDERERIAKAGQQRTLRDHSYRQRMVELDYILLRYLH